MARSKKDDTMRHSLPFPSRLRKLMADSSTTQDDLAKKIGKTRQTVSQYVNGTSEPGYDTLVKIADNFDVTLDFLLGRSNEKTIDTNVQAACKLTGLSENTILALNAWSHIQSLLADDPSAMPEPTSRVVKYASGHKGIDPETLGAQVGYISDCLLSQFLEHPAGLCRHVSAYVFAHRVHRKSVDNCTLRDGYAPKKEVCEEIREHGIELVYAIDAAEWHLSRAVDIIEGYLRSSLTPKRDKG